MRLLGKYRRGELKTSTEFELWFNSLIKHHGLDYKKRIKSDTSYSQQYIGRRRRFSDDNGRSVISTSSSNFN